MKKIQITTPESSTFPIRLAARELRRYLFVRTGILASLDDRVEGEHTLELLTDTALPDQGFRLHRSGPATFSITGGSDLGVLYGAYRFIEHLGVRFYLHGDVIPDEHMAWDLPDWEICDEPRFKLRGVNPWGTHVFGIDQWGEQEYKAVITQLAKMGMNFIGIHQYLSNPYDEPAVWCGLSEDVNNDGTVKASYPSQYFTTAWRLPWGPVLPRKTGEYPFGASTLFEDDIWGGEAMMGLAPRPSTAEQQIDLHNRMGRQFHHAFALARKLGVRSCVGTEAPIRKCVPLAVLERLQAKGIDPHSPEATAALYRGIFDRIRAAHDLDRYWIWTPETWTWHGNTAEDFQDVLDDIRIAHEVLKDGHYEFKLATCGWVFGPEHDRTALDTRLDKDIAMAAMSRDMGQEPLEPAFAQVQGRDMWAIPWLESDDYQGLAGLQLYAGRIGYDAEQAAELGIAGLMGVCWRTSEMAPNAAMLARSAWKSGASGKALNPADRERSIPAEDFYLDFARTSFGETVAREAASLFTHLDGCVPLASQRACPAGMLSAESASWDDIGKLYAFVDDFAALRDRVVGTGNLARFDYWLNFFRFYRMMAKLRCTLGVLYREIEAVKSITCLFEKHREARSRLMPFFEAVIADFRDMTGFALQMTTSQGSMGTLVHIMQSEAYFGKVISQPQKDLEGLLDEPIDLDHLLNQTYTGPVRIWINTQRSVIQQGETLPLKVHVLSETRPAYVRLRHRPLGQGDYTDEDLLHLARGVYTVALNAAHLSKGDVEYYVEAAWNSGEKRSYPPTAPEQAATLVVC